MNTRTERDSQHAQRLSEWRYVALSATHWRASFRTRLQVKNIFSRLLGERFAGYRGSIIIKLDVPILTQSSLLQQLALLLHDIL